MPYTVLLLATLLAAAGEGDRAPPQPVIDVHLLAAEHFPNTDGSVEETVKALGEVGTPP